MHGPPPRADRGARARAWIARRRDRIAPSRAGTLALRMHWLRALLAVLPGRPTELRARPGRRGDRRATTQWTSSGPGALPSTVSIYEGSRYA